MTFRDPAANGLQFRGFFIQSRMVSDMTTLVGEFTVTDGDNSQLRPCPADSGPVSDARNYRNTEAIASPSHCISHCIHL